MDKKFHTANTLMVRVNHLKDKAELKAYGAGFTVCAATLSAVHDELACAAVAGSFTAGIILSILGDLSKYDRCMYMANQKYRDRAEAVQAEQNIIDVLGE